MLGFLESSVALRARQIIEKHFTRLPEKKTLLEKLQVDFCAYKKTPRSEEIDQDKLF